jgi:phenylalanyl-tRNA synthetase beta chain
LVERDLSIIVPRSLLAGQLLDFVKELDEEWLEDVFLFDVYEGDRLAENEKSLALRLHYRSSERTLTDDEVNQVHQRVMDRIFQAFEARLQAG